jgi:hypothetical protein
MAEWSIALVIAVSITLIFLLFARGFVPPAARTPRPRPTTAPTPVPTTDLNSEQETKQLAAVGAP